MKTDKKDRGFTLAELLIVVAIIAVLVAIAIPVFGTALEKARSSVCAANRRNLKAELTVDYLTNQELTGGSKVDDGGAVTISDPLKETYVCPDNGTITASQGKDGSFYVDCSVHTSDSLENLLPIYEAMKGKISVRYDSNAYEYSNLLKNNDIKALVDNLGAATKTWAVVESKPTTGDKTTYLVWSSYETKNNASQNHYATIPAIAYDVENKTHSVGMTSVTNETGNVNGHRFPTIADGLEKNTLSDTFTDGTLQSFATLDEARVYYNTLRPTT